MSLRHRHYAMLGGSLAVAASVSAVALAATQQTYSQKFTVKHPGQPTAMTLSASVSAKGGAQQVKTVTLTFPAGTKINTGAVVKCVHAAACPAASKVGLGKAPVLVGGSRSTFLVLAYNRAGGMVLVFSNPVGASTVLKPAFAPGSKLVIAVPKLISFGPPPGPVLSSLSLTINKVGTAKTPYLRTPASCPKSGAWTFTGRFVYPAGTPTVSSTSKSACVKH
jgi:hypothetical protein